MAQTHPSDNIFAAYPVSKDKLTVKDALAVRKALKSVTPRIAEIGRSLAIAAERIKNIQTIHSSNVDRQTIAIIDTWLRQDYNKSRAPYNIKGNETHPSWWSLVWAVAHRVGGKDPAEAMKIAQNYKSFHQAAPKLKYSNVDTTPFEKDEEDEIADKMVEVWPLWYEIGTALNLPTSTLDLLTNDPQPFIAMIRTWITEGPTLGPPLPCWSSLVEVIDVHYGGKNPALAQQLAKAHPGTETTPQETEATQKPQEPQEQQPMETEPSSTTPGVSAIAPVNEGGQVGIDSAQLKPTYPVDTDPQPEIPLTMIADDGKPITLSHFVVYNCNKHNGGSKTPHGLALVIANENFQELPQRLCAKVDVARLVVSLGNLGYRVVVRENQTAEKMESLFKKIGNGGGGDTDLKIKKEDDSFICVITSHGDWDRAKNTDVIYGSDDGTIDLQETAYKYLGTTACEALIGKPKMFFVQACRGDKYGQIAADDRGANRLPHESDFFISYSTAPMTKAFRFDPNKTLPEGKGIDLSKEQSYDQYNIGSFYITEICMAFDKFSKRMDLMTIVLFVHQRLQADDKMLFKLGSKTTRQCPHMSVSLRGPVFFYSEAEDIFKKHAKGSFKI